jgi:hypothetical protein
MDTDIARPSASSHLRSAPASAAARGRMPQLATSTSRCRRAASPVANRLTRGCLRILLPIVVHRPARLGIPFVCDPGPELLSMEAIESAGLPAGARRGTL